ncbi:hypothetical protein RCH23_000611 [Cryobacterium sp. CAN_C3]|nr:hypothetical protein [Cryobacterium sp. CAN_C3]
MTVNSAASVSAIKMPDTPSFTASARLEPFTC